jgi:hypothetical protein
MPRKPAKRERHWKKGKRVRKRTCTAVTPARVQRSAYVIQGCLFLIGSRKRRACSSPALREQAGQRKKRERSECHNALGRVSSFTFVPHTSSVRPTGIGLMVVSSGSVPSETDSRGGGSVKDGVEEWIEGKERMRTGRG